MFSIASSRYYLFRESTDMRKSFDGLCGIISFRLKQNPMSGDVFIFINKPRNRMKLLRWEDGGFVLFYKRLEKGTFELPSCENGNLQQRIDYGRLTMIITGISMKNQRNRPRFFTTFAP
jgi:transposase